MFTDDINLFCLSNDIKTIFINTNSELKKSSEWFRVNERRQNHIYSFSKDSKINDYDIKRSSSIEFLRVLVDEHLSWTDHINILENKL